MRKLIAALAFAATLIAGISPAIAQVVPALADAERRTTNTISAQTGPFDVGFHIYGTGTTYGDWIEVWLDGVRLTPITDWTLALSSGTLATAARPLTNARVTLTVARTGTLQIVGARRPTRTSQFSENQGVSARSLNQIFTDLVAQNRETWDKINSVTGRAIVAPSGETLRTLPSAADRSLKLLGFDNLGNLVVITCADGGATCDHGVVGLANPSALIGLTAVNGSAATAMRSDAASALDQSISPTMTGSWVFNPGVAGILSPITASVALTGNSTGTQGWNAYSFSISADALNVGGQNFVNGMQVRHTFGGAAATGGRQAGFIYLHQTAITSAANANRNYVGGASRIETDLGDGGTNTGAGALGAYFGVGIEAIAGTGAVNLGELTGGEVNTVAVAGSTIRYKTIWSLVGGDAVQGVVYDAMLSLSNLSTATVGWKDGILIGDMNGQFPLTSGNVLRTIGGTINVGIDLSATTITSAAWKSPGVVIRGDGVLNIGVNLAGVLPTCPLTQGIAVGYNYLTGQGETDFFNCFTGGAVQAFNWEQITSGGAGHTQLMTLSPVGNLRNYGTLRTAGSVTLDALTTAGIVTTTSGGLLGSVAAVPVANGGTNCTVTSGTCLDNITGFASTGMMARTAAGTYAFRTVAGTAPITVTNGDGVAGAPTIACATCVTSAAALTANSIVIGAGSQAAAVTTTGTGVLTALGVNVGSAGAFVTLNGAGGTPSSLTLTNATGLPASGLTGTVLASNVITSSLTSLGTITSLTATTINAFALGGTISGAGNQINNVIIGTTTPLAGFFTTLTTTAQTVNGNISVDGFAGGFEYRLRQGFANNSAGGIGVGALDHAGGNADGLALYGSDGLSLWTAQTQRLILSGTGNITLTGAFTAHSATGIPAGGTAGAGLMLSSTANYGVFFGSGAPTLAAAKGSLYLRSDGSTTTNRAYINTDGSTTWTALTTGA